MRFLLLLLLAACTPAVPYFKDADNDDTAIVDSADADTDTDSDTDSDTDTDTDTGPVEDVDSDGYTEAQGDCDDSDASINPGIEEPCDAPEDLNCDGYTGNVDNDGDGYTACAECDDGNPDVSPDATEICNDSDDNCDGSVDNDAADAGSWWIDADGDGYGDSASPTLSCDMPGDGYVEQDGDCDDADATYYPGAPESCTDIEDYNCDGSLGYADADADGYAACEECNDANALVHPSATEECNGMDDNCDGDIDEGVTTTYYRDVDGDGHGDPDMTHAIDGCELPSGYSETNDDCADGEARSYPGNPEACDGFDNDCDGVTDPDTSSDVGTWYADADADGYGDLAITAVSCAQPLGYVADGTDCDDGDRNVSPAAVEICDTEYDDDCDGAANDDDSVISGAIGFYADSDGDGYGDAVLVVYTCAQPDGYVTDDGDCDDTNAEINFSAQEVCDGGIDNDCDGAADDADPEGASEISTFFADSDGDSYGDPSVDIDACEAPSGYVDNDGDCDDADSAVTTYVWYRDADSDGYGDDAVTSESCTQPAGYEAVGGDCDDTANDRSPGYPFEACNGVDEDCDGLLGTDDPDYDGPTVCTVE